MLRPSAVWQKWRPDEGHRKMVKSVNQARTLFWRLPHFWPQSIAHTLAIRHKLASVVSTIASEQVREKQMQQQQEAEAQAAVVSSSDPSTKPVLNNLQEEDPSRRKHRGVTQFLTHKMIGTYGLTSTGKVRMSDASLASGLYERDLGSVRVPLPAEEVRDERWDEGPVRVRPKFSDPERVEYAGLKDIAPFIGLRLSEYMHGNKDKVRSSFNQHASSTKSLPWITVELQREERVGGSAQPRLLPKGGGLKTEEGIVINDSRYDCTAPPHDYHTFSIFKGYKAIIADEKQKEAQRQMTGWKAVKNKDLKWVGAKERYAKELAEEQGKMHLTVKRALEKLDGVGEEEEQQPEAFHTPPLQDPSAAKWT